MKKNIQSIKQSFRTKEFRVFSGFFILSLIFWMFSKMSHTYLVSKEIDVHFVNIPKTKFIDKLDHQLKADIEVSGYELLKMEFINPEINIDANSELSKTEANYYWSVKSNEKKIKSSFSSEVKLLNISPDTLFLEVNEYQERTLPIHLNTSFSYAKDYHLKEHGDNIPVMKSIKRTLDPNNIMNPGKIFDLN